MSKMVFYVADFAIGFATRGLMYILTRYRETCAGNIYQGKELKVNV
jgi:hypothetical protein